MKEKVLKQMKAEDRANERLLRLIPPDTLDKVLSQDYCEIEPSLLCFAIQYEAVADIVPATMPVIDFGCYMAPQAYFFADRPVYVGVDCYELGDLFPALRRFQTPNTFHIVSTIQGCAEALRKEYPDAYAVCNGVPDEVARRLVSSLFPNHLVSYPGIEDDVSGICKDEILARLSSL